MASEVLEPVRSTRERPAAPPQGRELTLLSVVIPARDEEGCICSTIEHLHVELRLQAFPMNWWWWTMAARTGPGCCSPLRPELVAGKNEGLHGFGRAVIRGLDHMKGRRRGHHDGRRVR